MRRVPLLVGLILAATTFAGTGSAADTSSGLRAVEAKGPAFPVRTYVLTLSQGRKLTIHDVSVTENRQPVVEPTLTPASEAAKKTFGAVLVLDSSYSMTGKPIAAAIAAEQAFVNQLNPNEELGIIEFNRNTTVALPLTNSKTKINAALATPPKIGTGTHIYDAVAQAESMLNGVGSGSILLLSDGADTGSTKNLSDVTKGLASNMKIYTIGLDDQSYKPGTLKTLAASGHGQYVQAKAQALAPLFDQLSRQLSNEYLLQYKSQAGPNRPIHVQIAVRGTGTATTGYQSPALPSTTTTPAPYKPSIGSRIWGSAITMILLALLAAGVVALLVIGALQPRRSGLPARISEFVSIRALQRDNKPAGTVAADEQNVSAKPGVWQRFEKTLEIADIKAEPEMIVAGTVALTGLTFLLIYLGTGSPWWALFAFGIPFLVREWVIRTLAHRRNRFAEQLPDALQVVASALRAGHSFAGALAVVVESSSEPMKSEMQRVVADEQRGVPIQDSLGVVAERMASSDVEQLALVAQLQREAGGNAAEVIDRVAETVRERFDLKRLIATLTMQGRMTRWIVSALPLFIVVVISLENHHYFHPLTSTLGGRIVIGFATVWAVAGSLVIKKIVEIEV